jgi:hypothetical protein
MYLCFLNLLFQVRLAVSFQYNFNVSGDLNSILPASGELGEASQQYSLGLGLEVGFLLDLNMVNSSVYVLMSNPSITFTYLMAAAKPTFEWLSLSGTLDVDVSFSASIPLYTNHSAQVPEAQLQTLLALGYQEKYLSFVAVFFSC